MSRPSRSTVMVLLAASALTAWGLAGVLVPLPGYTDALFEPDYTILHAPPGSPLAEAGFLPGDSVLTVEGIPVVELGMYSRWPRSLSRRPGESLRLVVDRDGQEVAGDVVFREPPSGALGRRTGALAVGLFFLWLGVWAFLTAPSPPAVALLTMGLAMGLSVPGMDVGTWNGVRDHLQAAGTTLWALSLLGFFLIYPRPKRLARSRVVRWLLLGPWLAGLFCLVLELIYHPRFYHTFGAVLGLLITAYVLLAAVAVIHTAIRTPRAELRSSGMSLVLLAVAVALVPNLAAVVTWFLPTEYTLPGEASLPLLFLLVPVGMALGVRKQAQRSGRDPVARASPA